ncbi:nucleoporin, putative (macronuclear) [Tetrahymena thermophila SB210]|uniref:Nucleoporin, putative n=2 Tax=Tetrahymena thermophila TaxID=5911 RepID=W7XKR1_TETTS|nr:nucleoporin, putative [Tetrahymena thermophila SB210]EWS75129.1 nucleoporin, putative [Tetrahymena thermophila SB210]BAI76948.1 macronuclear nucleoporin MacNup98B [Tetrahymena thermophila]|eukprot:XP_012652367.1 nucleoporin, putative [Tetrahymena thermophila SB210]
MSLFGGGMIGQALGLTRGATVAPQNVPSAPVNNQGSTNAQNFSQAVSSQINTVGYQFKPCQPPNQAVGQKAQIKQTDVLTYLCCITGIDQFQQFSMQELMLNDKKLIRQGGVQPPQGNLNQITVGMGQNNQPSAQASLGMGGGGLFGGAQQTGGLFNGGNTQAGGISVNTQPAAGGGLFGGQTGGLGTGLGATTTTQGGGLFGGGTVGGTTTQQGGLFGGGTGAPSITTQQGGLFGGATQQPGGLLTGATNPPQGGLFGGNAPTIQTGGLFGGTPATQGGLFGGAQGTGQNKGGLFGTAPQTATGLFGQPQPQAGVFGQQQQQQVNQPNVSELLIELQRIKDAKSFSEDQQQQQDKMKNNKYVSDKNHINHINYLKSQQQKRNVLQQYTIQNKNPNKFIEAPYNVKVNVKWDNIKRNEWQILQRSQDIKNQTYINMGGEQRLFSNHNSNNILYNQLRQIERASYQYTNKSLAEKEKEYIQEQLESFSKSNYFKKVSQLVDQQQQKNILQDSNQEDIKTKENSIEYLYEQSLKNNLKVFDTTVSIKLYQDQEYNIIIPLKVKSSYSISYLLTLVFDFIEEKYNIDPQTLDIYNSNYVLYQPVLVEHLLQVRKNSLISDIEDIETNQQAQIGHFEVLYLDPEEIDEVQNEDDMEEEEYEDEDYYFDDNSNQDFSYLPIIPEGYYSEPNLKELITKSHDQLRHFKNFKIGNKFAEVCFEGEIDLIQRDFSKEILIKENEVIVYPFKPEDQPPIMPGYGINVQSTIKIFKAAKMLLQNEKFDIQKIERRLKKMANSKNMEIVEPYNPNTDSFTVRVLHF